MKTLLFAVLLYGFSFFGCKSTDIKSEQLKLLSTDREWSTAIAGGNIDRIVSFWTENAILYFPEAPVVIGRESIEKIIKKYRSISGFSFEHKPAEVFVSNSADFGYTTGLFNISMPDKEGNFIKRQGNYVSIWIKQKDESWKCSVNIGNYRLPPIYERF